MGEDGAATDGRGTRGGSGALAAGLVAAALALMFHFTSRALSDLWAFFVALLFVALAAFVWEGIVRRWFSKDRPIVSVALVASAAILVVMVAGFALVKPWETPDPPPSPTGLSLVAGDGVLAVSWDASPSKDTFQFEYLLRWKRSSQSWADATIKTLGDSTTSYTITGLVNDTAYDVQIEAQNLGGYSQLQRVCSFGDSACRPPFGYRIRSKRSVVRFFCGPAGCSVWFGVDCD